MGTPRAHSAKETKNISLGTLLESDFHKGVFSFIKEHNTAEIAGAGNYLSKAFFLLLAKKKLQKKRLLWVVPSKNELTELSLALQALGETASILSIHEKQRELQKDIVDFLSFTREKGGIILTLPEFLFLKAPLPERLDEERLVIKKGEDISLYSLFDALITRGYKQSEDKLLERGTYRALGDIVTIFPINTDQPIKVTFFGDMIEDLYFTDQDTGKIARELAECELFPMEFKEGRGILASHLPADTLVIADELELKETDYTLDGISPEKEFEKLEKRTTFLRLTSFPEAENFFHIRYLSFLKYYTQADFLNDVKERYIQLWSVVLYTKQQETIKKMLQSNEIVYAETWEDFFEKRKKKKPVVLIVPANDEDALPRSFQNPEEKIAVITDREIFLGTKKRKTMESSGNTMMTFLASLKPHDYVVHADHGIGIFTGIEKKTIDTITKEYLKIEYAENDKLFVPTDQADKVSKYISNEEKPPKLTRLDSSEWATLTKKVKTEAKKIAKELLELYAKRELAKGVRYATDTEIQETFERTFPYDETPGQIKAIHDVKRDMESEKPMDRLVCGDVGFGKTEVAMRAAFKAVQNKKQVAVISPITILADQHYKSFCKRMEPFGIHIEMLSRFKSPAEQKTILKKLAHGEVDIVIGTHRLIQKDVAFKDLGLLIVDEEQRFGVGQKERIKEMRCDVDILTLSATPIPRTLHMSLNKIRDITTITTPPPGRLPIITEVRKYSDGLVIDSIKRELERGGQVYFLHNKVRTIEGVADKLRKLIPDAKFVVAHGQLDPRELEKRILAFKNREFDVLVSSTIIENGIDLSNANTLVVNNADSFGLSQLYQLRGRVGRSKTQAYTYLLYSSRKLGMDAKKRLRAIVEASELGSGFQIAMKDLEIRGAGDILGSSQHGMINSVGVSHFIRMLNQQVEELKERGGSTSTILDDKQKDVVVEMPLTAYIPDWYIPEYEEKIASYQKLSSIKALSELEEYKSEMEDEYGELPEEIVHLCKVIEIKIYARRANVDAVRVYNQPFGLQEINLLMAKSMRAENIFSLLSVNPKWFISGEKLKISINDLNDNWYNGLIKALNALSEVPKQVAKVS